jgi:hypothetical protein
LRAKAPPSLMTSRVSPLMLSECHHLIADIPSRCDIGFSTSITDFAIEKKHDKSMTRHYYTLSMPPSTPFPLPSQTSQTFRQYRRLIRARLLPQRQSKLRASKIKQSTTSLPHALPPTNNRHLITKQSATTSTSDRNHPFPPISRRPGMLQSASRRPSPVDSTPMPCTRRNTFSYAITSLTHKSQPISTSEMVYYAFG